MSLHSLHFLFLGNLAVSASRPSALRTDLAIGVPCRNSVNRVSLVCDYRCRVFDELVIPASMPSEPDTGSELREPHSAIDVGTS